MCTSGSAATTLNLRLTITIERLQISSFIFRVSENMVLAVLAVSLFCLGAELCALPVQRQLY